jgi:hypothetical protein
MNKDSLAPTSSMARGQLNITRLRSALMEFEKSFLPSINKISLDDLPLHSKWPKRLLGIDDFRKRSKNKSELLREYETEKWGPLYQAVLGDPSIASPEEVLPRFFAGNPTIPCLIRGEMGTTNCLRADQAQVELLSAVFSSMTNVSNVFELGSGFGSTTLQLARKPWASGVHFSGGELAPSGVALGNLLSSRMQVSARFSEFNFLDSGSYALIPEGAVIFSCMSLVSISLLGQGVMESILNRKPSAVVFMESLYPPETDASLLHLMVRRYIDLNDYNRDLFALLESNRAQGKLKIDFFERDVFGFNPLLPSSLAVWTPQ